MTSRELTHRRPFAARLAAATTAHHIRLASRLRSQGMLATTEGSQIAWLCAEDFDWDPLLDDPSFLLACERPTERAGLAAALESLRMLLGFADHTGRTGLVTIRDFLPHLLLAWSPEIEPPQHRNTVLYRIQRIQKLTGLDLQNPLDQNRVYER